METRTNLEPESLGDALGACPSPIPVREQDADDMAYLLEDAELPYYAELEDGVWSFYVPHDNRAEIMEMCEAEGIEEPDDTTHPPDFATGNDEKLLQGIASTNPGLCPGLHLRLA